MDDSIHVEVQVVEFKTIGVRFTGIDRNRDSIDGLWFFFDDIYDYKRVFVNQPSIEGGYTHLLLWCWWPSFFVWFF